jgi:hypothetical protein
MRDVGVRFAVEMGIVLSYMNFVPFLAVLTNTRNHFRASRTMKHKTCCILPVRDLWMFHLQ